MTDQRYNICSHRCSSASDYDVDFSFVWQGLAQVVLGYFKLISASGFMQGLVAFPSPNSGV